eukprot:TRINITY_DN58388_c0_g1_i1.p1 TRINITY_DN58388_c0_g1~~TRINITY_DN58388_c0_g1_i1.p1  ORF type:complete len:334 (+),score=58.09 TRINITY_DN58388_c0_g1_i1:58-1059(+)
MLSWNGVWRNLLFVFVPLAATAPAGNSMEALISSFRMGGWALSREVLDPQEVVLVADKLRAILMQHGRRAFGNDEGKKEVRFTFAVHEMDDTVADFVAKRTGRLWQQAARLAGTQELCILMDRGFSKDPGDPETHWHRDDEAIGLPGLHPEVRTVHAWIPLAPMNKSMGTLQYLLGTHRRDYGWLERLLASLWGWEFAWFATARTEQDDNLQLGDVAWHDGWILHSAGSNSDGAVRDALAVSYAYCPSPEGCGGSASSVSLENPACRAAELLFDAGWRERHRNGENDYAKTLITEPLVNQALRVAWRSIFGALGGLAVHQIFISCCSRKEKVP